MRLPLVSICIPTYNGAQFIAEAIDSAMAQTYSNVEIVVSDDASVDDTLEIINAYRAKTNIPIHIHQHQPNGIGANWNHCIKKAKGTFIKFLFQDDVLLPDCISKMVQVMEADKSVAIVASKRNFIVEDSFIDEDSDQWIQMYGDLQHTLPFQTANDVMLLDYNLFRESTFFESPMNKVGEPTTILFRKDLIDQIGYFREDLKQVLDYEFCYRVLKKQRIAIINKPLVAFRLHGKQTTVINKQSNAYTEDFTIYEQLVYKNYRKHLHPETKKRLSRKYNKCIGAFYDTIDAIRSLIPKK